MTPDAAVAALCAGLADSGRLLLTARQRGCAELALFVVACLERDGWEITRPPERPVGPPGHPYPP